jgi:RND superfamily putative drug exporter
MAFAILLDATLVRALLVPALTRLFGERNWWAPKSLKRFTINH